MTLAVQPPPWVEAALCAQVDPDIFHPDKGGSNRAAKRVCARCDVRADCLADALADPERRQGVLGGTTEYERRQIRRDGAA